MHFHSTLLLLLGFNFFLECRGESQSCSNVAPVSSYWPGGMTYESLLIPVSSSTTNWTLDITFSEKISHLLPWNASVASTGDNVTYFPFVNMDHNGAQPAGSVLSEVGFHVAYKKTVSALPVIKKILFNGEMICSGKTATTKIPTAPVTSTSKTMTSTIPPGMLFTIANAETIVNSEATSTSKLPTSTSSGQTTPAPTTSGQTTPSPTTTSPTTSLTTTTTEPSTQSTPTRFTTSTESSTSLSTTTTVPTTNSTTTRTTETTTQSTTTRSTTTTTIPTTLPPLTTKYNYSDVLDKSLQFYYVQRSGPLPADDNPITYRSDSAVGDVGQNGEDLSGGYYSAASFIKYGFSMASMTTVVAWSIIDYPLGYVSAGQLTTAQKMVKWSTDYFIKAHVAPNKLYVHVGNTTIDHKIWRRPEDITEFRPSFYVSAANPGSDVAGETAAALAAVSIVFAKHNATYSDLCLSHAKTLYTFAKQNLGIYSNSMPANEYYQYLSSGYGDELAWAALWLYRATQNTSYLNDAKTFYQTYNLSGVSDFYWESKTAGVQLLLAKITNETTYLTAVKAYCDAKVSQPKSPKGLLVINAWGSLRYAANAAYICLQAADLNINSDIYRQFAQKQIHYALGDTGRSFVGGFGTNPPVRIHHRSSSCPKKPAPCDMNTFNQVGPNFQILNGGLVGGPDSNDTYADVRSDYVANEVTIDYNAGFQAAVAVLQTLAVNRIFN